MDLPENVIELLNDRDAVKTLTTTDDDGTTSVVNLTAIKAPKPNVIELAEVGAKQLNKELLRYMDAGGLVSILCRSAQKEDRLAYQIVCRVREFQTSGPLYEKFLDELRARYVDLDGVWVLEPVDVVNRSRSFDTKATIA
jgi:hypothetical protein